MSAPIKMPPDEATLRQRYGELMAEAPGDHPLEDEWVRFASSELDATERIRFADHVSACAACAKMFHAVAEVRSGAREIDPQAPALAAASDRPTWWYVAAAAAVLVAAAGSLMWPTSRRQAAEPVANVATPPPVAPSAPITPDLPQPRDWAALPPAPAVSLPIALTLPVRGSSSSDAAFMQAFGAAIAPFRESRFAEAATALAPVTQKFPQMAEGWFYLGVSSLFANRPADAVEPLRRARTSTVVGDEARWLEAVALERAGRTSDANDALQKLCNTPGPNQKRACEVTGSRQ